MRRPILDAQPPLFLSKTKAKATTKATTTTRGWKFGLAVWGSLLLLLLANGANAFGGVTTPPCTRLTTFFRTSRHSIVCLQEKTNKQRAGAHGYSLLRQPVDFWNVSTTTTTPVGNNNNNQQSLRGDADWWQSSTTTSRRVALVDTDAVSDTALLPTTTTTTTLSDNNDNRDDTNKQQQQPSLDLIQRSYDTLEMDQILLALSTHCVTVPAKRLCRTAAASYNNTTTTLIATTLDECEHKYGAVRELMTLLQSSSSSQHYYTNRLGYRVELSGRPPPILNTFAFAYESSNDNNILQDVELLELAEMMDNFVELQCWSRGLQEAYPQFVHLPTLTSRIVVNATLHELLHTAFDTTHNIHHQQLQLNTTTFPQLKTLRNKIQLLKTDILDTLNELIATKYKPYLHLESGGSIITQTVSGRLLIPVRPQHATKVGVVHDQSRSGQTLYVEVHEIVPSTNALLECERVYQREELQIWQFLTDQVVRYNNHDTIQQSIAAIAQLDLVLARYRLGQTWGGGVIPKMQQQGVFNVQNAKHPLLLLRHNQKNTNNNNNKPVLPDHTSVVVGSDVSLGQDNHQGLILTGPNAGGKTVVLKLLGLYSVLAKMGLPLPCEHGARVDFFDPILADIGDLQSINGDLSTFSGHMLLCKQVLESCRGPHALVLLDELGSGTDPNQGVAIAQAILEALLEKDARVALTTHYLPLKQLAASDDRFSVAGMQFINGRPTYKLLPGMVGESFALAVAERLGLPQSVLERANQLLDSETRQMGDLIRDMEDQKAIIDAQAQELKVKMRDIKEKEIKLERKQLDARRIEARKFAKTLEEKEQTLETILNKLKSDPSRRVVANSWNDLKLVKRDALNEAENVPSVLARKKQDAMVMDAASAELVPIAEMRDKPVLKQGDTVIVCQKGPMFGREADVIQARGNRVELKVNGMPVSMKLTQVAMPSGAFRPVTPKSANGGVSRKQARSRAAQKVIFAEGNRKGTNVIGSDGDKDSSTVTIRTASNTIDVRGSTLSSAQDKIRQKFSGALMAGRPIVYILHGHGTGGVLKSKIRGWLKTEKLVKRFAAADMGDGGDAFTRVELR